MIEGDNALFSPDESSVMPGQTNPPEFHHFPLLLTPRLTAKSNGEETFINPLTEILWVKWKHTHADAHTHKHTPIQCTHSTTTSTHTIILGRPSEQVHSQGPPRKTSFIVFTWLHPPPPRIVPSSPHPPSLSQLARLAPTNQRSPREGGAPARPARTPSTPPSLEAPPSPTACASRATGLSAWPAKVGGGDGGKGQMGGRMDGWTDEVDEWLDVVNEWMRSMDEVNEVDVWGGLMDVVGEWVDGMMCMDGWMAGQMEGETAGTHLVMIDLVG